MPDEVKAPQGMVFQTEEDRVKAMDAVPENPPDDVADRDAWIQEMEAKEDAIIHASIDPNHVETIAAPPDGIPAEGAPASNEAWYKEQDWTFSENGQTITLKPEDIPEEMRNKKPADVRGMVNEVVSSRRYAETKKNELELVQSSMQTQMDSLSAKMDAMKQENERLKTQGPVAPGSEVNKQKVEHEKNQQNILDAQTELDTMMGEVEKLEEEDPDQANIMTRKALRLSQKLQIMRDNSINAKMQEYGEISKRAQDAEAQAKKDRDAVAAQSKADQAREARKQKMAASIDSFGNNLSELKMSKDFQEVEKDYVGWVTDATAAYYNIPSSSVTAEQCEVAVNSFLNRTPDFIIKLKEKGIVDRVPKDLRKYLINTELYLLTQGQEIDPKTGKIKVNDWKLPDMDAAWDMWKRKKGLKYKEEVDAANKAETELLKVMNPAGVAEVPAPNVGAQAERDAAKLSAPEAENIFKDLEKQAAAAGSPDVDQWIGILENANPHDDRIKLYNKAFSTLHEPKFS